MQREAKANPSPSSFKLDTSLWVHDPNLLVVLGEKSRTITSLQSLLVCKQHTVLKKYPVHTESVVLTKTVSNRYCLCKTG